MAYLSAGRGQDLILLVGVTNGSQTRNQLHVINAVFKILHIMNNQKLQFLSVLAQLFAGQGQGGPQVADAVNRALEALEAVAPTARTAWLQEQVAEKVGEAVNRGEAKAGCLTRAVKGVKIALSGRRKRCLAGAWSHADCMERWEM